jgi:cell division protein FtsL
MTASTFAPRPEPRRQAPAATPLVGPLGPATPARPHLRVVGADEPRSRRLSRFVTGLLVVAVFAGLFAIVAVRVVLAQGQAEIDALGKSIEAQQAVGQDLRLAVAELEAPAQIVAAARQRLGMVTPVTVTYLTPPATVLTAAPAR